MQMMPQCLKITEKVSFNIASVASFVYILSGQKFIKMPKMVNLASFWKPAACSATRHVNFDRTNEKLKWDILDDFQTL